MDAGKECRKCGVSQPLEAYSRDRSRPDGRRTICKACDAAHDRQPAVLARKQAYHYTAAGKDAEARYAQSAKGKAARAAYEQQPARIAKKKATGGVYALRYAQSAKGRATRQAYLSRPDVREHMRAYKYQRYHSSEKIEDIRTYAREWQRSEKAQRYRAVYRRQGDVLTRRRAWQCDYEHVRRARQRALPATLTPQEWQAALEWFGHRCAYCGTSGPLVREHVIPLIRGGPYTAGNIVPACKVCNNSKKDRSLEKWATSDAYARVQAYIATVVARD